MFRLILVCIALLSTSSGMVRIKLHEPNTQINQAIHEGITNFGINLHKLLLQHSQNGENVVFSPVGIYVSLALAHLGANGQTRDELRDIMGFPKDSKWTTKIHQNLGQMIRQLQNSRYANVSVANGVFVQNDVHLKDSFKEQIQSFYNNQIVQVDFAADATQNVNNWFSTKTGGKISTFYEDAIPADTKLLLANVLCFNGQWYNNFPSESTKTEVFYTEDGHQQEITMMHKTDNVLYYDNQDHQYEVIGLPYKQNEYLTYFVLPHEGQPLKDLAENFNINHIKEIVKSATYSNVDIKLPQLKLKTNDKIKEILRELGINQLFDNPDLSNMLTDYNLKVSEISYSMQIEINEEGTDVCSGTSQEYKVYEQELIKDATKQFYVQKPHIFFIYHPTTDTMLFYGSIYQVS